MRLKKNITVTIASDWFTSVKPLPCFLIWTCHLMDNSYNSKHQHWHCCNMQLYLCKHKLKSFAKNYGGLLGSFSLQFSHIEIIFTFLQSKFSVQNSHFSRANLTFLQCKSHISPVQISHFSHANLTFLPCKSHISPVPISHFSHANLTFLQCKSHTFSVQISHFSRGNLTFLPCKSHLSPVQI